MFLLDEDKSIYLISSTVACWMEFRKSLSLPFYLPYYDATILLGLEVLKDGKHVKGSRLSL